MMTFHIVSSFFLCFLYLWEKLRKDEEDHHEMMIFCIVFSFFFIVFLFTNLDRMNQIMIFFISLNDDFLPFFFYFLKNTKNEEK